MCAGPKTDHQFKTISLLINSYFSFALFWDMCYKLISSNLDNLKKKHFQALKNVIGNGYLIGYGCFYLSPILFSFLNIYVRQIVDNVESTF